MVTFNLSNLGAALTKYLTPSTSTPPVAQQASSPLAKDPVTGLNKFQAIQQANQAITAAGGTPSYVASVAATAKPTPTPTPTPTTSSAPASTGGSIAQRAAASTASASTPPKTIAPALIKDNAKLAGATLKPGTTVAPSVAQIAASQTKPVAPTTPMPPPVPAGNPVPAASGPKASTPGYQSSYNGPDMAGMQAQLNSQYDQAQAAQLQQLRNALQTALQGYNAQETQANQSAYANRNAADVTSMQNAQGLREAMATMGLGGDGQNLTLQTALGASRLGAINDINQTQANALQDISQKRSLLQNNEAANELALIQQLGSDKAAALLDLLKYGDQQSFNVDQAKYGRYRDDINQQFAQDQFDWNKQTDLANLLGTINGQQTLAAKNQNLNQQIALANLMGTFNGQETLAAQNQNFSQQMALADLLGTYNGQTTLAGQQQALANKQSNWNAYMDMVNQTGNLGSGPTQTWGNLANNANSGAQTLAGQNQQLNQTQTMAQLTGTLPNGQKTTAEQQRQLENLWQQADLTGTIPDQLATLYGIPKGTQTQAAYQFAQNLALNQDQNDLGWVRENFDQQQAANQSNAYDGMSPNQVLDSIKTLYTVQDPSTKKNRITADPTKREQMFLDVIDNTAGMTDAQVNQIMGLLGLTKDEVAKFTEANAGK